MVRHLSSKEIVSEILASIDFQVLFSNLEVRSAKSNETVANKITLWIHGMRSLTDCGDCYENGQYVDEDQTMAEWYYCQAALEGDAKGYLRLGQCNHRKGNYDCAMKGYLKSACLVISTAKYGTI